MKKVIEYIYYKIYIWKKNKDSEMTAFSVISLLIFFKLFILFEIIDIIYNIAPLSTPKVFIISIMGSIIIINYFWFIHKKKYLKIIKKYKDETKKQGLVRGLLVILYFILIIGIILLLAYINKHNILY